MDRASARLRRADAPRRRPLSAYARLSERRRIALSHLHDRASSVGGGKELLAQFFKFGLVGVGNTLLSLLAFELLKRLMPGTVASGAAFLAGAVNGYWWNRRWTFAAADSTVTRVRYLIVQLAGLGLTTALFWLFRQAGLAATVAYLLTVATVTLTTFAANRHWTFARRPELTATPQPPSSRAGGTERMLGA